MHRSYSVFQNWQEKNGIENDEKPEPRSEPSQMNYASIEFAYYVSKEI